MSCFKHKSLDEHIDEMQNMAKHLVFNSCPLVPDFIDADTNCLKQRQFVVDGYEVLVRFSRSNYDICFVETLEVASVYTPFLPMYLVCKLAAKFLGGHELKFGESFKNGRKVYIWSVAIDERGRPIPLHSPVLKEVQYENFVFSCTDEEAIVDMMGDDSS